MDKNQAGDRRQKKRQKINELRLFKRQTAILKLQPEANAGVTYRQYVAAGYYAVSSCGAWRVV